MTANARLDFAVMQATRHDRPSLREYAPPPLKGGCSFGELQRAVSDNRDRYFDQSRRTTAGKRAPIDPET